MSALDTQPQHPTSANPSGALADNLANISGDPCRAAIMGAGIPIVGMDLNGLINLWNTAAARLFGFTEQEVLGKSIEVIAPPEFRPIITRAVQRTLQQHSVNHFELAFVPPGGKRPVHLGGSLSCIIDPRGECVGVMAWMRDISNRKELESHLSRSAHMASLGTLAAGVAHHFNNIVGGMSTMVDFALHTQDPAAMSRALRMADEAASRISYITQGLLAFSDSDQNNPEMTDLTQVIRLFADVVQTTLAQKAIRLELDLQARRNIQVPKHRFSQLLHHLLRNSEEAFLQAPPRCDHTVRILTRSQEDQVLLQFSDTGCGISADLLTHVFDPFFTTKGVQQGGNGSNPGLGLSLVHGVVMDLAGHVWAESTINQGTTINILLPVNG